MKLYETMIKHGIWGSTFWDDRKQHLMLDQSWHRRLEDVDDIVDDGAREGELQVQIGIARCSLPGEPRVKFLGEPLKHEPQLGR